MENEITLETVVKLRKEIMDAREQAEIYRRNGFFELNLKLYLKDKEKELAQISNQIHSNHAWRPL